MAYRRSTQMNLNQPVPAPMTGVDLVPITGEFVVPAALAVNDVIEMGAIPEQCIVVDAIAAFERIDSNGSGTLSLDMGLISGTYGTVDNARTCGNEIFAADTSARAAGGGMARLNKPTQLLAVPVATPTGWGFKVGAAAATLVVGARIRATVFVRPAPMGIYTP